MNVGLRLCTGDYIGVVEADDKLDVAMYESLYRFAIENGNPDFVKSDFFRFYGEGASERREYVSISSRKELYESVFNPSREAIDLRDYPFAQPGIYRRDFLGSVQVVYHESPGAAFQDTGFWLQVVMQGRTARYLNRAFYMLRRDNLGSSTLRKDNVFTICSEYHWIRDIFLAKQELNNKRALGILACYRWRAYRWNCMRINTEEVIGFVAQAHADFLELEEAGELQPSYLTDEEQDDFRLFFDSPVTYAYKIMYAREKKRNDSLENIIAKTQKQLCKMRLSNSYRVGRAITSLPRWVKRFIRNRE